MFRRKVHVIARDDLSTSQVSASFDDFDIPVNAIEYQSGLAVAQFGTGSVVLERDGQRHTLIDGLDEPSGLVAQGCALFVADRAQGIILRVSSGLVSVVATELLEPEGLALDALGNLRVVESGAGRITEIDPHSGAARILASGLDLGLPGIPGYAPSFAFNGITRDARGHVYVTGDGADLVYVLTPYDTSIDATVSPP